MAFDPSTVAESVPVYVREDDDGTASIIDTATNTAIQSGFLSARVALQAALGLDALEGFVKAPVLRTDGEPDAAWRWLDATAVEDEPIGGVRIGEQSIWEMAASVNTRATPYPINGGGAPEGLGESKPHGDAYEGGDHLANGWVHVGLPVVAKDGRLHLFFRVEIIPELAPEVDRGRLAFGSVFFNYEDEDEDDNFAALGATLISHALTNDHAVTTLTAGSERRRVPATVPKLRRAACSLWSRQMTITIDQIRALHATATATAATPLARYRAARALTSSLRGAAADVLASIRDLLGLTAEDDDFAIADAVWKLVDAAKVEDIIEASEGGGGDEGDEETVAASASERAELVALAKRGLVLGPALATRAQHGLEGEELDEFADAVLDFGRTVLDEPDAAPAEVVEKLQELESEIKAVIEEEEEEEDESAEGGDSVAASAHARLARQRNAYRTQRNTVRTERDAALAKVARFELRDYLTVALCGIGKAVDPDTFDRWINIGLKNGRPMIDELVANRNAPPSAMPLDEVATPRPTDIRTAQDAWNACEDDALAELEEVEAKRAKKARRDPCPIEAHHVVARSQDIATARYPALFGAAT